MPGNFIPLVWFPQSISSDFDRYVREHGTVSMNNDWRCCITNGSTEANCMVCYIGPEDKYYYIYTGGGRSYDAITAAGAWSGNSGTLGNQLYQGNIYYSGVMTVNISAVIPDGNYISWDTLGEALEAYSDESLPSVFITYIPENCTLDGPASGKATKTVTVNVSFPEGYGLATPNDIYVMYNGVVQESTYDSTTGQLTFVVPMPE